MNKKQKRGHNKNIQLIKELDREIQQVRITSQILDVTDNLFENLGRP